VLKDPFVLEFLGLEERAEWRERELEQAIIDRIEEFLLELGKGFCFVARQKRVTLEGDHFYVDLIFYNRLLRCFVLVDLKLGKLTHQDLGQMQMYVNFFDRFQRAEHEAKTIGIVLCSDKNGPLPDVPAHRGRAASRAGAGTRGSRADAVRYRHAQGDFSAASVAWLTSIQNGEVNEDRVEPPPPPVRCDGPRFGPRPDG
jgi:hypothetical protein